MIDFGLSLANLMAQNAVLKWEVNLLKNGERSWVKMVEYTNLDTGQKTTSVIEAWQWLENKHEVIYERI